MARNHVHKLIIRQTGDRILRLELSKNGRRTDAVDFSFDKNVDTLLIRSIDKFLKRNKIDILSLKTMEVAPGIDKNSSLYKVARTFVSAVNTIKKSL